MNINPPNRTYSPSTAYGSATQATTRTAIAHANLVSASIAFAGIVGLRHQARVTHMPALEYRMQWAYVAIADLESRSECVHRAYLNSDDTWNGWACPYFEKPEVKRMALWLSEFDDSLVFGETTDAFTTTYDPDAPESFTGTEIDGMHLYPIGNGSWTWSIVEGNTPDSESPKHCQ